MRSIWLFVISCELYDYVYDLAREELKSKLLAKDINIDDETCLNNETYVRVIKLNNKYQYQLSLECTTSDKKTKIYTSSVIDDSLKCNSDGTPLGPTIVFYENKRLKDENKSFPDLIIVDGGLGQINEAKEALNALKVEINILCLYKNDKHQTEGLMDVNGKKYVICLLPLIISRFFTYSGKNVLIELFL